MHSSLTALSLALAFGLVSQTAAAQVLYKLIDKNGKITYSEEAPKNFDGQVIKIEVDPNRNTATLPKFESPKAVAPAKAADGKDAKKDGKDAKKKLSPQEALKEGEEQLEAAKKALADARDNPKEGEVEFIGKVTGGARPRPTEAYEKRLQDLEKAVKDAEDALKPLARAAR